MTERPPKDTSDHTPGTSPDTHQVHLDIGGTSLKHALDILTLHKKAPFEHGLAASRTLYERIGTTPPPLDAFEQSGVDFDHLFQQWTLMMQDGLNPVALFTKTDLSIEEARALFAHLRADKNIENNPLQRHEVTFHKIINGEKQLHTEVHDGLVINSGIVENWHKLTAPQQGLEVVNGWSLRLIASNLTPQERGAYESKNYTSEDHASLAEYLTLQAVHIEGGGQPIDPNIVAWLGGGIFTPHGLIQPRAPFGTFDPRKGYVTIGHDRAVDNEMPTSNYLRPARS